MKLSFKTLRFFSQLTILSFLLPLNSVVYANAAVGVPTDQQSQQLNQQQQDTERSNSAGAAQAMAAMGAAMSMMGCMMGMKAAQQEPDPAKKQMMMSMAMQQCAQGAQNAASAAQNGDQKKKLDAQPPQNEPFKLPEMEAAKDDDSEKPDLSKLMAKEERSASEDKGPPQVEPFEQPKVEEKKSSATAENKNSPIPPSVKPGKSVPNVMPAQTITADREGSEDNGSSDNSGVRSMGSALAGRGSADDLLKQALASMNPQANPNNSPMVRSRGASVRKEGSDSESGNGGSSGGSSAEGAGGNSAFDNFLAQMMGGGASGASVGAGFGGGSDIVYLGKDKNGQPKLNIFQFASSVYSELSRSNQRVSFRRNSKVSAVNRVLSTEPNLVTKSSVR